MNGSGCIAGGEQGLMANDVIEQQVRRGLRWITGIAVALGALWCGLGIWELASRTYITAKVEGLIAEDGQCRRPSGRYQNCIQSKVSLAFTPKNSTEVIRTEILIPNKGVSLQPGDPIQIGYRTENPKDIEFPDVSGVLQTPLGIMLTALFIMGLERLTR